MDLTVQVLEYLHDAELHGVVFDSSAPKRSVSFTATFHDDCGVQDLDARQIRVVAEDITLLTAQVHGVITSLETIDYCSLSVSTGAVKSLAKWIEAGGRKPRCSLMLVTHGGSIWEIMCESISIEFA